jgi:hypothetical protein
LVTTPCPLLQCGRNPPFFSLVCWSSLCMDKGWARGGPSLIQ